MKTRFSLLVLTFCMIAALPFNSKATMICTDLSIPDKVDSNQGISICEKMTHKDLIANQMIEYVTLDGNTQIESASFDGGYSKDYPTWARYILVSFMGFTAIKYLIAERARKKCNALVRNMIIYYNNITCNPDKAREMYRKYYREDLSAWEYLIVFKASQLITDLDDKHLIGVVNHEVNTAAGMRTAFNRIDFNKVIEDLHLA